MTNRSQLLAAIRAFCAVHPQWALFDEPSATLLEVGSGKRLALTLAELTQVVERQDEVHGLPYLLIGFGDGRELAVAHVGIAFPPVRPNAPQAPPLPSVVCLKDFEAVCAQVESMLGADPDQRPPREAIDLVVLAIGILDGARLIGFDVSDEERRLDGLLARIERR